MAISDPYQSAKWLKVHLTQRYKSHIIHDALFSEAKFRPTGKQIVRSIIYAYNLVVALIGDENGFFWRENFAF